MNKAEQKTSDGRSWPRGIILFFLVIAGMQGALLYLAFSGKQPMIVQNPYQQGLQYEDKLALLRSTQKSGVNVEPRFVANDEGALLELRLLNSEQVPLSNAEVKLHAVRPGDATLDRIEVLTETAGQEGTYLTTQEPFAAGLWHFSIHATHQGQVYLFERKEFVS